MSTLASALRAVPIHRQRIRLAFGVLSCDLNPDFSYRSGCRALLYAFWAQRLVLKGGRPAPVAKRVS